MIRIGIVGCGRILAAHLRGYRLLREAGIDDFRITALCARKEEDAQMYVERGKGPAQRPAVSNIAGDPLAIGDEYLSDFQDDVDVAIYTDYREMIADGPIDAVNDFSTHALHHQVADVALSHGKHLLTQKPLAATMAAGRKMCQQAEAQGLTFAVFENFRHEPITRHLRWAFESGRCGRPQLVLVGYVASWWAPDLVVAETPWRHSLVEGGGISLDLGVHFFDQIRHVVGEIDTVSATTSIVEPRRFIRDAQGATLQEIKCDADDSVVAAATAGDGVLVNLCASWAGHGEPTVTGNGAVYYGSKARVNGDEVTFDDGRRCSLAELYQDEAPAEVKQRDFPHGIANGFALSQLDWLRAIEQNRPPQTDGQEGLRDLAAAYALLESHQAGTRIQVKDVLNGNIREYQRPIDEHFGIG